MFSLIEAIQGNVLFYNVGLLFDVIFLCQMKVSRYLEV